ncbi:hypothetical protein O1L60_34980 [Streptomyces diastatochromogenes]|nr:hypothetical protein [Streptomyces diastatochromogenes]
MAYVNSRQVTGPTADQERLIHRRAVRGAVGGGIIGMLAPAALTFSYFPSGVIELLWRSGWSWALGGLAVLACGALGTWSGARLGRINGVREGALEAGEAVLSLYSVRPPVVDGRPTKPADATRFELRVTDRSLQLWDGPDQLWRHPWSELRLTEADDGLLLVHHGDRAIAELLLGSGEVVGPWDALLLGAQRLRARRR